MLLTAGIADKLKKRFAKSLTPRAILIEILKMSLLLALISPPVLMPFYKFFVFTPDTKTRLDRRAFDQIAKHFKGSWQEVRFPSKNGKMLCGYFFQQPQSKYTLLVSHGSGGNAEGRILLVASMMQCGTSVFIYDYQGYGQSEGQPSPEIICEDGVSAYDYLTKQQNVSAKAIVLYGESIGCAVALHTMSQRSASAVVVQNPFTSLLAAARHRLPWFWLYPDSWFPQLGLDNIALVKKPHPPILFINGEKDIALPSKFSDELFAASAEPKARAIFPNAGHDNVGIVDVHEYIIAVSTFLKELP